MQQFFFQSVLFARSMVFGGLLSLGMCWSSGVDAANVLAFWQAVDIAQARNPQIHKSEALLRAAREDNPKTMAKLLPIVNFRAIDVLREGTHYKKLATSQHADPRKVELSVDQKVFNLPSWLDHSQSDVHVEAAYADLMAMRQDITLRVATVTSNWLEAKEVLDLAVKYKKVTLHHMQENQLRLDAGEGTQIDMEQASSRHHQAQARYQDALNTLEKETAFFKEVVGTDPDANLALPNYSWEEPADLNTTIWKWIEDRPEIWAARARLKENGLSEEMERSAHWPTVNLNYTTSHTWDSELGGSSGTSVKDEENAHSVSLVLNLPLFTGMETLSRTREAKAIKESSLAELDRVRTLAKREVEEARYDLKNNKSAIVALEKALDFSEKAAAGLEESFLAGTRTLLDLLDAQFEVHTLQTTLVRHRFQAQLAVVRLWKSLGRMIQSTSPAIPHTHQESVLEAQAGREEVLEVVYAQMEADLLQQSESTQPSNGDSKEAEEALRLLLHEVVVNQTPKPIFADQARSLRELTEKTQSHLDPVKMDEFILLANKTENPLLNPFPKIVQSGAFMVHVGTFTNESSLTQVVKILVDAGIPSWSEKIKTPDDHLLTRLLVGPFATHAEVMDAMGIINRQYGGAVGWLPILQDNEQPKGVLLRLSQFIQEKH